MSPRLAPLVLLVALACGREPASDEPGPDVDEIVRGVVEAIGEREVDTVMRQVALGFRGGLEGREPNLGYAEVQEIALEFLLRDHALSARLDSLRVDPPDPSGAVLAHARVWFDASTALADAASAVPESAVGYRFDLRFERREGTWQAVEGTYARLDSAPAPPSGG
jgi:hypothetical protein